MNPYSTIKQTRLLAILIAYLLIFPIVSKGQKTLKETMPNEDAKLVVERFLSEVKKKNFANAYPFLDSLIEWHQPGIHPLAGVKLTAKQVSDMTRSFLKISDNSLELFDVEYVATNDNEIACVLHWRAQKASGEKLDVINIDLYSVKYGKIKKAIIFSADIDLENRFWN
jgi:hypothetical protein